MKSAFGVDHGEISKNWWQGATKAQKATKGVGLPTGPEKIKGALRSVGETKVSLKGIGRAAGRGTQTAGSVAERFPGTTGTALVGGGGAAGYKALEHRINPKKKKKS